MCEENTFSVLSATVCSVGPLFTQVTFVPTPTVVSLGSKSKSNSFISTVVACGGFVVAVGVGAGGFVAGMAVGIFGVGGAAACTTTSVPFISGCSVQR